MGQFSLTLSLTLQQELVSHRSSWKIRSLVVSEMFTSIFVHVCYSNSWRRRLQSPTSQSGPFHRHPARPSTAAWCRSSMMRTGSVVYTNAPHWTAETHLQEHITLPLVGYFLLLVLLCFLTRNSQFSR